MDETPEPPLLQAVNPANDAEGLSPATRFSSTGYFVAALGLVVAYLLMLILGGEFRAFAIIGLFNIPFVILSVLAYRAEKKSGLWKALALAYWVALAAVTGLVGFLVTIAGVVLPGLGPLADLNQTTIQAAGEGGISLQQGLRILAAISALLLAGSLSLACFLPVVRRKAALVIGIDPKSFVHATALATVVAITLICVIPLLAVGEPPLLPMLKLDGGKGLPSADEQLRTTFYTLIWGLPAAFVAVGYPFRRTLRETRQRLGLERPGLRHLAAAVVMTGVLLLVMPLFGHGIESLWKTLGWPITDQEAIELLFAFTAGPIGAVITSVVAGLGEEVVFRGVLQPRLGIVLPALMFTSVHAFQYNFDGLIQVLVLGVLLGLVRKRTNTTTSAIIHFGYDFVLLATTIE